MKKELARRASTGAPLQLQAMLGAPEGAPANPDEAVGEDDMHIFPGQHRTSQGQVSAGRHESEWLAPRREVGVRNSRPAACWRDGSRRTGSRETSGRTGKKDVPAFLVGEACVKVAHYLRGSPAALRLHDLLGKSATHLPPVGAPLPERVCTHSRARKAGGNGAPEAVGTHRAGRRRPRHAEERRLGSGIPHAFPTAQPRSQQDGRTRGSKAWFCWDPAQHALP